MQTKPDQIVQYIDLVDHDTSPESDSLSYSYTSENGVLFPFIPTVDFSHGEDGHGMHTAGTAAGATPDNPATLVECDDDDTDELMGCAGKCLSSDTSESSGEEDEYGIPPLDRLCHMFDCEGAIEESQCLGDDVADTVAEHGGMAQGAKIAVIDIFWGTTSYGDLAGAGLFQASMPTGAKVHSNSWGIDKRCLNEALNVVYDAFMFEVGGCSFVEIYFQLFWEGRFFFLPMTSHNCCCCCIFVTYAGRCLLRCCK